ncbi:uncharacterized protein AB9W97_005614 [Spinachia spinachia]
MRRFFGPHKDEDHSQIQYLTAKCTRLAHDKAALDRDLLLARGRERKLHGELEAAAAGLRLREQINAELRIREEQLVGKIHQQQDLVERLQQRLLLLAEASSRDGELLRQVGAELLCLQSSEVKLEGLVEELHAEAQRKGAMAESLQAKLRTEAQRHAALTEGLQAEQRRKRAELEELRDTNQTLTDKLKGLRSAHPTQCCCAASENEGSLRKLRATAEQFEWLCQQQRSWMACVKRFKDSLTEERDALLRQVVALNEKAAKRKKSSRPDAPAQRALRRLPQDTKRRGSLTSLDADAVADLESRVEKSNMLYAELFSQAGGLINGHQKPP